MLGFLFIFNCYFVIYLTLFVFLFRKASRARQPTESSLHSRASGESVTQICSARKSRPRGRRSQED